MQAGSAGNTDLKIISTVVIEALKMIETTQSECARRIALKYQNVKLEGKEEEFTKGTEEKSQHNEIRKLKGRMAECGVVKLDRN